MLNILTLKDSYAFQIEKKCLYIHQSKKFIALILIDLGNSDFTDSSQFKTWSIDCNSHKATS